MVEITIQIPKDYMYLLLQSENTVQTGRGKRSVKAVSAEGFKIIRIFLGQNP